MAFGTPCARKDLNWCRVLVPQTPFRCHCSGLTGPSSFSDRSSCARSTASYSHFASKRGSLIKLRDRS
ncbi:hypothetical protein GBA52_015460 [Prunus armeniaca]|nr:hypothetical protein GBA52_015460 [Prunus armeniaca]